MRKRIIGIFILIVSFCILLFNMKTVYTLVVNGTTLLGDVNGDWVVDKKDVRMLARYIINKDANNFYIDNADYNFDGDIKMNDAIKILKETTNGTVVFIPTQGKTTNSDGTEDIYDTNEAILFRSADGKPGLGFMLQVAKCLMKPRTAWV